MSVSALSIPTDYTLGYEKARAVAPDIAANYIAHTHIGDSLGEAMMEDLAEFSPQESGRLIQAAMNQEGEEALKNAPASLREFFRDAETPAGMARLYSISLQASACFTGTHRSVLAAFVAGVLIEGFTNEHSKVLLHHGASA